MSIVLDATCGYGIMWGEKRPNNYVGIDIRPEVIPTIIGDAKKLPIRDRIARVVYLDPPHHIPAKGFWGNKKYGEGLSIAQRRKLFVEVNKEFARTLDSDGLVIAKITNMPKNRGYSCQHMDEVLERELTNFKLIKKSTRPSKSYLKNEATLNWMVFSKSAFMTESDSARKVRK